MVSETQYRDLARSYPVLSDLPWDLQRELTRDGQFVEFPSGETLFDVHSPCSLFLMLTSGTIRVIISAFLLIAGCTDPTEAPVLVQLLPNPVVPLSTRQNLDFLGSNMDPDIYFLIDTGAGEVQLEPENIPGVWTFRCVFGFHYIYTFDSLEDFLDSLGSPSELTVRAFNVGANLVRENGGGDDLGSQSVTWEMSY